MCGWGRDSVRKGFSERDSLELSPERQIDISRFFKKKGWSVHGAWGQGLETYLFSLHLKMPGEEEAEKTFVARCALRAG